LPINTKGRGGRGRGGIRFRGLLPIWPRGDKGSKARHDGQLPKKGITRGVAPGAGADGQEGGESCRPEADPAQFATGIGTSGLLWVFSLPEGDCFWGSPDPCEGGERGNGAKVGSYT